MLNAFYEPCYIATIVLPLRRTLVLKNSYELRAIMHLLMLVARSLLCFLLNNDEEHKGVTQPKLKAVI